MFSRGASASAVLPRGGSARILCTCKTDNPMYQFGEITIAAKGINHLALTISDTIMSP